MTPGWGLINNQLFRPPKSPADNEAHIKFFDDNSPVDVDRHFI
jgi:hypothetical protein